MKSPSSRTYGFGTVPKLSTIHHSCEAPITREIGVCPIYAPRIPRPVTFLPHFRDVKSSVLETLNDDVVLDFLPPPTQLSFDRGAHLKFRHWLSSPAAGSQKQTPTHEVLRQKMRRYRRVYLGVNCDSAREEAIDHKKGTIGFFGRKLKLVRQFCVFAQVCSTQRAWSLFYCCGIHKAGSELKQTCSGADSERTQCSDHGTYGSISRWGNLQIDRCSLEFSFHTTPKEYPIGCVFLSFAL